MSGRGLNPLFLADFSVFKNGQIELNNFVAIKNRLYLLL